MSAQKITIVDYGMGNLGSIQNMLHKLGAESILSSDVNEIEKSDKLILPGVGHFARGVENLDKLGLRDILNKKVLQDKIPVLGICLGMQLMGMHSEEGEAKGLGWLNVNFKKFDSFLSNLKVPCMGWNEVSQEKTSSLMNGIEHPRFYFVHSYYAECANEGDILLKAKYGLTYAAGFQHENIYGVQFHPEKSHKFGMQLFQNYLELV